MRRKMLDHYKKAAAVLAAARLNKTTCSRISDTYGITSIDDAYRVQEINTVLALESGRRIVGRKIGLTSEAVQKQLGVDQPDFGMLYADMEIGDGETIDISRLVQPKVEGEIAFVLKRDLPTEDTSLAELISSIDYVLPALEVVDTVIDNWDFTLADTIADNASSGLYVLGKTPISLESLNLELEGMLLHKNGELASMGVGAACLGNPLNACLWLARTMSQKGRPLLCGDVILSGALGPMVNVTKGDTISMSLTRLGKVSCKFA